MTGEERQQALLADIVERAETVKNARREGAVKALKWALSKLPIFSTFDGCREDFQEEIARIEGGGEI